MRVLLSTYGGRGDVEPLVGLAVRLRERGADVQMCAPPDSSGLARCAQRLAEVGVPLVSAGPPVRPLVHGAARPSPADLPRLAAEIMAVQFETLAAAAEGFDALLTTGLLPAAASAGRWPRSSASATSTRPIVRSSCPRRTTRRLPFRVGRSHRT